MPLKHFTETLLIVILALVFVFTGLLIATLPPLPQGILPGVLLLVATLLYPLALYPLFRSNRADYEFRLLHFVPAAMVTLWFVFDGLRYLNAHLAFLVHGYTFGWTLGGVILAFFLLAIFCLSVLRRWLPRLITLFVLLLVFSGLALASGLRFGWENAVADTLWQGKWWDVTGTGMRPLVAVQTASSPAASSSAQSQRSWQDKLRAFEAFQRSAGPSPMPTGAVSSVPSLSTSSLTFSSLPFIVMLPSSVSSAISGAATSTYMSSSSARNPLVVSSFAGSVIVAETSSSSAVSSAKDQHLIARQKPLKHLPKSGPAEDSMVFFFLAGYMTVLHRRAKARRMV